MIKLADSSAGKVSGKKVFKAHNGSDIDKIDEGIDICKKILQKGLVKRSLKTLDRSGISCKRYKSYITDLLGPYFTFGILYL